MPIDLIDTIKPKNGGSFPMVEAEDVVVGKGTADEKRLPEALAEAGKVAAVDTTMPASPTDDHVPSTQLLKEELAKKLSLAGGTVEGILRLKNPKVAADDDTRHDIALVPNANGQGLQVQFPSGKTAMVREQTGTLATVAEVNAGLAKKQNKLTAGENVTLTEQSDGTVKIDAAGGGAEVPIDTTMPASPADDHVPSTQLLKETADNVVKNGFLSYNLSNFAVSFGYNNYGSGKDLGWADSTTDVGCIELFIGMDQATSSYRIIPTKEYVDERVAISTDGCKSVKIPVAAGGQNTKYIEFNSENYGSDDVVIDCNGPSGWHATLPTKSYVDGLVGDIKTALAAI